MNRIAQSVQGQNLRARNFELVVDSIQETYCFAEPVPKAKAD